MIISTAPYPHPHQKKKVLSSKMKIEDGVPEAGLKGFKFF